MTGLPHYTGAMTETEPLIEQIATPVAQLDPGHRIVFVNAAFSSWLEMSARRFIDRGLEALGADGGLDEQVRRARDTREPLRVHRVRLAPAADRERFADVWITPAGEDALLLEFHAVEEFPGDDPAIEVPAALHEALKGLAHEIRNPLAGIRGAAQLLARHLRDSGHEKYVDVILESVGDRRGVVDRDAKNRTGNVVLLGRYLPH